MSESFSIKKESKSLMFLNEDQVYETANRSPLPMQIDYDKLISSGVIEPMDIGYNLLDIRSILPHPKVSVDPMYKRMNLNEVIELLDENRYNFIHSRTLQSYIYADYYDLELQPVVAVCYALLIDQDETKVKISKYSKYIPWVYTMIRLFLLKKRDFMRSADLDFVHELLLEDLKKIHVASSQELLEYSGENLTGIKLSFLLRRKFKKLGLNLSDINKRTDGTEEISAPVADETIDQSVVVTKVRKPDRTIFSPTLIQQIEQEAIETTYYDEPAKSTIVKKIPIKRHMPRQDTIAADKKVSEIEIPTDQGDEIRFSSEGISQITDICKQAIDSAFDTSPTDLLVSIFAQAIYPEVIGKTPSILDLRLIEVFNEVGEMTGVSNTVDFSRNLGDMQERWDKFEDARERIITSFVGRINNIASHFVFNSLFRDLLERKINRIKS